MPARCDAVALFGLFSCIYAFVIQCHSVFGHATLSNMLLYSTYTTTSHSLYIFYTCIFSDVTYSVILCVIMLPVVLSVSLWLCLYSCRHMTTSGVNIIILNPMLTPPVAWCDTICSAAFLLSYVYATPTCTSFLEVARILHASLQEFCTRACALRIP